MRAARPSCEEFGIDKGAVSRQVQHLVDLGLLDRQPDPDDGRAILLVAHRRRAGRARPGRRPQRSERFDQRLGDWTTAELVGFADQLALQRRAGRTPSLGLTAEGRSAQPGGGVRRAACRPRPGRWRPAPRRRAAATGVAPQLSTTVSGAARERAARRAGPSAARTVVAGGRGVLAAGSAAPRGRTPASSPAPVPLRLDAEVGPVVRLRDPRLAVARAEAVRRRVARPRDRDPAAVAADARRCGATPGPAGPRARRRPAPGRAPRPGRGTPSRAAPASSSVAARARARPRSPPPYRVRWRTTSWLLSTQVGAAPTGCDRRQRAA